MDALRIVPSKIWIRKAFGRACESAFDANRPLARFAGRAIIAFIQSSNKAFELIMTKESNLLAWCFLWTSVILHCGISPLVAMDLKTLPGHVPSVLAGLEPTGRLAATNELRLAIGLVPSDEPGLDRFVQELYDPASPNYRHYLAPAQFAERFGPTEQDYQALIDFAAASGLNVSRQYSNRVVLDVKGSVAKLRRLFI